MSLLNNANQDNATIHVIGQGLAGSVLALLLEERGYKVSIYDDGHQSSSSIVAGGMWNPVSFKKLHASWLAQELLPEAESLYRRLEKLLGVSFFHPVELIRIFPDNRSANEWDERSVHPELSDFIARKEDQNASSDFKTPYGHGVVQGSGWLNVPVFLEAAEAHFRANQSLTIESFTAGKIQDLLRNDDIVILATGWKHIVNSGLDWLPVLPNKGQVLTVSIPGMKSERMFNFGKFIVPLGDEKYRLGATYELNPTDVETTKEAFEELISDLKEHCNHAPIFIDHKAGFRPTVPDRKPLLGFDTENPRLGFFNGFGSKGVMLIPYFAKHLIDHMALGTEISAEVHIRRYIKRFKK